MVQIRDPEETVAVAHIGSHQGIGNLGVGGSRQLKAFDVVICLGGIGGDLVVVHVLGPDDHLVGSGLLRRPVGVESQAVRLSETVQVLGEGVEAAALCGGVPAPKDVAGPGGIRRPVGRGGLAGGHKDGRRIGGVAYADAAVVFIKVQPVTGANLGDQGGVGGDGQGAAVFVHRFLGALDHPAQEALVGLGGGVEGVDRDLCRDAAALGVEDHLRLEDAAVFGGVVEIVDRLHNGIEDQLVPLGNAGVDPLRRQLTDLGNGHALLCGVVLGFGPAHKELARRHGDAGIVNDFLHVVGDVALSEIEGGVVRAVLEGDFQPSALAYPSAADDGIDGEFSGPEAQGLGLAPGERDELHVLHPFQGAVVLKVDHGGVLNVLQPLQGQTDLHLPAGLQLGLVLAEGDVHRGNELALHPGGNVRQGGLVGETGDDHVGAAGQGAAGGRHVDGNALGLGVKALGGAQLVLAVGQQPVQQHDDLGSLGAGGALGGTEGPVREAAHQTHRGAELHSGAGIGGHVAAVGKAGGLVPRQDGQTQPVGVPADHGAKILPGHVGQGGKVVVAHAVDHALRRGPGRRAGVPLSGGDVGKGGDGIVRFRARHPGQNGDKHGTGQGQVRGKGVAAHPVHVAPAADVVHRLGVPGLSGDVRKAVRRLGRHGRHRQHQHQRQDCAQSSCKAFHFCTSFGSWHRPWTGTPWCTPRIILSMNSITIGASKVHHFQGHVRYYSRQGE